MCLAELKGFAQLYLCRRVRIHNFVLPAARDGVLAPGPSRFRRFQTVSCSGSLSPYELIRKCG